MKKKSFQISNLPLPTSSLPPFDNDLDPRIVELHFVIRNEREEVNDQHDNWNGYFALLSNGVYLCRDGVPIINFIRDHIVHSLGGTIGYDPDSPTGTMNEIYERYGMTMQSEPGYKRSHEPAIPIADLGSDRTRWDMQLHTKAPLHPDSLSCREHSKYHSRLLLFKENAVQSEICSEKDWMCSAVMTDALRLQLRRRARQLLKFKQKEQRERVALR